MPNGEGKSRARESFTTTWLIIINGIRETHNFSVTVVIACRSFEMSELLNKNR